MDLFNGLSSQQVELLRRCASYRDVPRGTVIFREEDPAYGIFTVLRGKVRIYRGTKTGTVDLAEVGPNGVFGEMGLVRQTGTRTASAAAVEDTLLFEVSGNPVDALSKIPDKQAALRFVQNLVCILAQRLRAKDRADARQFEASNAPYLGDMQGYKDIMEMEDDPERALDLIEHAMPKGLLRQFFSSKKLAPGDYLCREGDAPDGFYLLRSGVLEAVKEETGSGPRVVNEIVAPTIAGEAGFFAGENRSASLVAQTNVTYTHFSAADFQKLRKDDPDQAFRVLFAAAQLLIYLILHKESRPSRRVG